MNSAWLSLGKSRVSISCQRSGASQWRHIQMSVWRSRCLGRNMAVRPQRWQKIGAGSAMGVGQGLELGGEFVQPVDGDLGDRH